LAIEAYEAYRGAPKWTIPVLLFDKRRNIRISSLKQRDGDLIFNH